MRYVIDRMTVGWNGVQEVQEAALFRKLVGDRLVSHKLKELARAWMQGQKKH